MGLFKAMEISTSALTAERLRMDLISNNLANLNTTRTAAGGPYRRKFAVQEERGSFEQALQNANAAQLAEAGGVRVTEIREDQSDFKLKYDPTHPDADANGNVRLPNVDMLTEITDMLMAQRIYEANATAFNASKSMMMRALEIGR